MKKVFSLFLLEEQHQAASDRDTCADNRRAHPQQRPPAGTGCVTQINDKLWEVGPYSAGAYQRVVKSVDLIWYFF